MNKNLGCIGLLLILGISFLSAALPSALATQTNPIFNIVPSGTSNSTGLTQLPTVGVGSTFSIDIRLDNIDQVTQGINGISYTVTYDPAVLSLTYQGEVKGPIWSSVSDFVTAIVTKDAVVGSLTEHDVIANLDDLHAAVYSSGVVRTLTFMVLSVGESNIDLQPSDAGVAYLASPDGYGGSVDVVADHSDAVYGQPAT